MMRSHEDCYRAVTARDARFDGVFFTAVRTTGIFCRPSCPARTPDRANVEFFATAASAIDRGYRACRRCRPDTTPGSPQWNPRADVIGRAMRLIADGEIERSGVPGLADRLGYSDRHLNRLMNQELGVGPLSIARSQRAITARLLIETTDMPMADIAFASGFGSIRQFNTAVQQTYARTPSELRHSRPRGAAASATIGGVIRMRLPVRPPFDSDGLLDYLSSRAITGTESVVGDMYARVVQLPRGLAVVALEIRPDHVQARFELADLRDVPVAVERSRRLLDLDADPLSIDRVLGADPVLSPLVRRRPGVRLPGSFDPFEVIVRSVVGQQISVSAARSMLGRIVEHYGELVHFELASEFGLVRAFPTAPALRGATENGFAMPRSRARTIIAIATAIDDRTLNLDVGADRSGIGERLLEVPGIGPWTADYVRMRALSDPDVLLETDLAIRRYLKRFGLTEHHTQQWRPWRSYAAMHIWHAAAERTDHEYSMD